MSRHSKAICRTLIFCCAIAAASSGAAGTVDVSFINPRGYDAGSYILEEEATLQALARHLQGLGQRFLPQGQVLKLEVLDLVLAGTERTARTGRTVRIVRGGADFPRIELRYTLQADGRTLRSGQEWVSDMNYTRGFVGARSSEPLYYEKRMLDNWFRDRFVASRPAGN